MSFLTKQQIFNKVSTHLLKQGKKAVTGGSCRYKHGKLKCSIGCLIPEERYKPQLEGQGLVPDNDDVEYSVMDALKGIIRKTETTLSLLFDLQEVHDEWLPRSWKGELIHVAKNHRLKVNFSKK